MMAQLKILGEILFIFTIPFGGGIPAGVLLAQSKGVHWVMMLLLYFLSDILLALIFEPLLLLFVKYGKNIPKLQRFTEILKMTMQKTIEHYGNSSSVLALVMISFGVDPMTGRSVAKACGHGMISGWLIAITGDMFYFALLMVSTLWLKSVLGDGTLTMFIIFGLMFVGPSIIKKIKLKFFPFHLL